MKLFERFGDSSVKAGAGRGDNGTMANSANAVIKGDQRWPW
jgi:hypothetical protein